MTNLFCTASGKARTAIGLVAILALSACSGSPSNNQASKLSTPTYTYNPTIQSDEDTQVVNAREESFFTVYNQWQGVPYRLGGMNKNGIDCSAFVQVAYRDAWKLPLPRTTISQSKIGENIEYRSAKYGDLVFFQISRRTKHVGVYLGNSRFMHASTSKGVIISRLDNPYWASKFWQFRRIETETK